MYKFKFADIGEGLHEGVVGEVYKKVGDVVKEGDSLFSVETDKVTSDIPSPVSGTITEVKVKTGEVVHVGDDVFHFDTGEGEATNASVEDKASDQQAEPKEEESGGGGASVVGEVKVSNSLLSFGSFGKSSAKAPTPSKPEVAKVEQPRPQVMPPAPTVSIANNEATFDIANIKPVGNGEQVDIVVIGAGPGGYTAAEFLAKEGFKTIVIEKQFAGGVCLNIGCIPTKTLLKSAKVFEEMKKSTEFGIDVDQKALSLNWKKMKERKDKASEKLRNGVKMLLRAARAELIEGEAKIIDQYNVEVNGRKITTKVIILATGSSPIVLPLPGFKEGYKKGTMIDSTAALNLEKIPQTLTVIGGGVIGMEFAMLYQELGSKVTILEGTDSILGQMDNQVKQEALKILNDKKIEVKTSALVKEYKDGAIVYEQNGKKATVKAEKVLVSVGRKPNNLGLDQSLGLKVGKRGEFVVNDNFQTSMPNIFAIGDCNAEIMLAHVAYRQAHVVRSFIAKKRKQVFNIRRVPSCVYTHPEISSVGYTEEELKKMGIDYIKSVWQNQNVGRVISDGAGTFGFAKLLVKKDSGEILGAHIINNNSSDMITEIISIMELEGTVFELANTVHPHPSIAEAIYEAAVHAVSMIEKQN